MLKSPKFGKYDYHFDLPSNLKSILHYLKMFAQSEFLLRIDFRSNLRLLSPCIFAITLIDSQGILSFTVIFYTNFQLDSRANLFAADL